MSLFAVTSTSGTLCIAFYLSPLLSSSLLRGSFISFKSLAKEYGWKKCSIGLGSAGLVITVANVAALGLRTWVDLNTYLRFTLPPLLSITSLGASAATSFALERLTGEDEEDEASEGRVQPVSKLAQAGVLTAVTILSFALVYFKFYSTNPLGCNEQENEISSTNTTIQTQPPINDPIIQTSSYAIALLTAFPLKFAGKLAFNMMRGIPNGKIITPVLGGSLLVAEAISFPFQCNLPLILVVAFTIFAAMATRLVEGTCKKIQLGK